jgi:drug/metabolite transporter (DMT)-like permease
MTGRLSLMQISILVFYATGMAGGQLLFKAAAMRFVSSATPIERILGLLLNGYFIAALLLYAALSLLWVWVLSFTPLSRAYPFVALAFALTPFLGMLAFAEPFSWRLAGGILLILCGLVLVVG